MQAIAVSVPTVAVSVIYCLWYSYYHARLRCQQLLREQVLRERVACLLWAVANLPEGPEPRPVPACSPSQPTPLLSYRYSLLFPETRGRQRG